MRATDGLLVVTPGDPGGIGPEIAWKAAKALHGKARLLFVGARAPFDSIGARVIEVDQSLHPGVSPPSSKKPFIWLLPAPVKAPAKRGLPGYQAGWSIQVATRMVQEGVASALVTGPIAKDRLQQGGYKYTGHTDFLADLCGAGEVTMMLANDQLRITLVTVHMALKDVPRAVTRARIRRCVEHTAASLRDWWGIRKPRIGVAALNPHAGESGLFGDEEIRVIQPALDNLRRAARGRYELHGPLPGDTLFANHVMAKPGERFDAVVAMYHDQGLIPVKLLDFPKTVNVTLGLPIIRTSVDHGTGFDIAGRGIADPSSMIAAIRLALEITHKRRKA